MAFEHYIRSGQKMLRCGYTTGTCAALAAAGAARLLLTGQRPALLCLRTPKGWPVEVEPAALERAPGLDRFGDHPAGHPVDGGGPHRLVQAGQVFQLRHIEGVGQAPDVQHQIRLPRQPELEPEGDNVQPHGGLGPAPRDEQVADALLVLSRREQAGVHHIVRPVQ